MPSLDLTPFTPQEAQQARAAGFSHVCSMCVRLHEGRRLAGSLDWDKASCTSMANCRGPLGGGAYLDYAGPMKGALHNHCWLCGVDAPDYGAKVRQENPPGEAVIGCCPKCLKVLRERHTARPAGTPGLQPHLGGVPMSEWLQ